MNSKAIICKNLTKQFGNFKAVDQITFDVEQGEIFGFLGANGAGRTIAMRMFGGLSFPTSGEASVAGFNVYKEQEKIKASIGYMSQKFSLYENLTVFENIEFYGGVPMGWKQKLAFSVAIFHRPKIVFLDEPTGGVDPITRRQFWDLIYDAAANGITVFVTTHSMDEAE